MRIGILSDSHGRVDRTRAAVDLLVTEEAEALVHCGDLGDEGVVAACARLPFHFVFGNHDADLAGRLRKTAQKRGANCLGWGGEVILAGKRVAVVHGHLTSDLRPLLAAAPDYLLSGHSHDARDWREGRTRRINPGALFRASQYTVAVLDLATDELRFLQVPA